MKILKEINNIQILSADRKDVPQIAYLHKQYISEGFLSLLGIKLLTALYENLIQYKQGLLFVAKSKGKVIGFISAAKEVKGFYRYFLKHNFLKIAFILIPRIMHRKVLKGLIELGRYPKKAALQKTPDSELLSIVVIQAFQSKGIALKLLKKLVEAFKGMRCGSFKVVVGCSLKQAIAFYEKAGFKRTGSLAIHKGSSSFVYIYRI